jgi:outer membrane biosynthesis protein TonB
VKLFAIWVTLVVLVASVASAAPAAGAEPQPDAVPQAPAVTPDPAPGAAQDKPETTQQPPPAPPAETQTQPQAPAATPQPAPTEPQAQPRRKTGKRERPARERRHTSTHPRHDKGEVAAARPSSMPQIKTLLPRGETADDSSSHVILLAAGALLALVLASGSMLSVSSRAMKGQLR